MNQDYSVTVYSFYFEPQVLDDNRILRRRLVRAARDVLESVIGFHM